MTLGKKGKNLICGAQDGSIFIYSLGSLSNKPQKFKAHNIKSNGTSYVSISEKYGLVYSGGYDGSFMILKSEDRVQIQQTQVRPTLNEILNVQIQDLKDESVMHYNDVL